jgi:hypothetical protein
MVIVLKKRMSEESFHGSPPPRPMTPFFETATTKAILGFIGGMIKGDVQTATGAAMWGWL